MKKIVVLSLILSFFVESVCFALSFGNTICCYDFSNVTVVQTGNSNYSIPEYNMNITSNVQPGQLGDFSACTGVYGKSSEDSALHILYNAVNTGRKTNPWNANYYTAPLAGTVKKGETVQFSGEIADSNAMSSISILLLGKTENKKNYQFSYQQLYPVKQENKRNLDNMFMKFDDWFYFVDVSGGGTRFIPGRWYKYDVIIDTENKTYGGQQTIGFYIDGKLHSLGILDADRSTDEIDLIKTIDSMRIITQPRAVQNADGYFVGQNTEIYLDNLMLNVLRDGGKEPAYRIDGKNAGGSYRPGSVVQANAYNAYLFAKIGMGNDYRVSSSDADGDVSLILDGNDDVQLFLWDKQTFAPYGLAAKFVAYNESIIKSEDFSGLPQGDISVCYVNSDKHIDVFSYSPAFGKFGKAADDCALFVSNSPTQVVTGKISDYTQGVDLTPDNMRLGKNDTVTISFDYAQAELNASKALCIETDEGAVADVVNFYTDGRVMVLGTQCLGLTLGKDQWYHFDIVLNSDIYGGINTCSAYINGKKYLETVPFAIGGTIEKALTRFKRLQLLYNIYNSPGKEDGFYLDNVKIRTMQKSRPQFADFDVSAKDALFNLLLDNENFMTADYGQDAKAFVDSLKGEFIKSAEFVSENGSLMDSLHGDGTGYLRIRTDNGYDIYYKLAQGTDSTIAAEIDKAGNANPDTTDWYAYEFPDITQLKSSGNPLNLADSTVKDIQAHGFIKADGEYFTGTNDGEHIDFWGCNVIGPGCFPEHSQAEAMADMIKQQGFNLVRFHQMSGRDGSIFIGSDENFKPSDTQMNKLCYFLKQLRERGIYYFFDLGIDKLPANSINPMPNKPNLVAYFDSTVQQIQINYAQNLLTYPDPYDGNGRICDNPALAAVICVNETNLFMEDIEKEPNYNIYYADLKRMWNEWLKNKYPSTTDRLIYQLQNLKSGESFSKGNIELGTIQDRNNYTDKRVKDILQFFNSKQEAFFGNMKSMMESNQIKTLMSGTTIFGMMEPQVMKSNLATDFVDVHRYWAHPDGYSLDTGVGLVLGSKNETGSMLKDENLGIIQPLMNRKPYNIPYTISEWNTCASSMYLAEGPMLMAAYSKMQNWYPMQFLFAAKGMNNYEGTRIGDVFDLTNHPIRIATMPAAAMMRKNISEARYSSYVDYSGAEWYDYQSHKADGFETQWKNFDMFSTHTETGLVHKTGIALLDTPANTAEAALAGESYTSDTGELTLNHDEAYFAVNTNRSKAVTGFFSGKEISVGAASFQFDNEFAAAYINSLDENDVNTSGQLLLTVVGKAVNSGQVLSKDGTRVIRQGTLPILVEPICGSVKIKTGQDMKVYALDSSGRRKKQIQSSFCDGMLTITLSASDRCMNYEVISE